MPLDVQARTATIGGRGPALQDTRLIAARPNPFNPRTEIAYRLARAGDVALRIVDAAGRQVRILQLHGAPAGEGSVAWDGTDDLGAPVASGVYHVVLEAGDTRDRLAVTLVK